MSSNCWWSSFILNTMMQWIQEYPWKTIDIPLRLKIISLAYICFVSNSLSIYLCTLFSIPRKLLYLMLFFSPCNMIATMISVKYIPFKESCRTMASAENRNEVSAAIRMCPCEWESQKFIKIVLIIWKNILLICK